MDAHAPTHPVDACNANTAMCDDNDGQHSPHTSPTPPALDASRFPHIIDRIIELAPILALVKLHDVSRYVRAKTELRLSRHLRVTRDMYDTTTFVGVTHEYCLEQWEYGSDFPSRKPDPICLGDDCPCGPRLTRAAAFKAAHKVRILDVIGNAFPDGDYSAFQGLEIARVRADWSGRRVQRLPPAKKIFTTLEVEDMHRPGTPFPAAGIPVHPSLAPVMGALALPPAPAPAPADGGVASAPLNPILQWLATHRHPISSVPCVWPGTEDLTLFVPIQEVAHSFLMFVPGPNLKSVTVVFCKHGYWPEAGSSSNWRLPNTAQNRFGYLSHVLSRLLCALDRLTLTLVGLDEVAGPEIGMPLVRPLNSDADHAAEVEKWFYDNVTVYLREIPKIGGLGEETVQDALCNVYFKDRELWLEEDHGDFDLDDWNPFGDDRF